MQVLSDNLLLESIGQSVETVNAQASEIVIVSPFVKESALKKLLCSKNNISTLKLVTKAVIGDFASGISDIGVWPLIWHYGGSVLVNNDLHAKYLRFDSNVYLGSANVTDSGLGYATRPNIELMLRKEFNEDFDRFEKSLLRNCHIVSEVDFHSYTEKVKSLIEDKNWKKSQEVNRRYLVQYTELVDPEWIPLCMDPGLELWPTYCGIVNYPNAIDALESLGIPAGIDTEAEFIEILGLMVSKLDLTRKIHFLFDHNTANEKPFISFGTLKHKSNIKWDRRYCNDQINASMSLLEYALPKVFYYEPPKTWSRLLGRTY